MSRITLGNVTVDRDRFEVWVDVRRVDLTFSEFELLYTLARNAGKVLAR
jgi:two-component system response regulator ArlR